MMYPTAVESSLISLRQKSCLTGFYECHEIYYYTYDAILNSDLIRTITLKKNQFCEHCYNFTTNNTKTKSKIDFKLIHLH